MRSRLTVKPQAVTSRAAKKAKAKPRRAAKPKPKAKAATKTKAKAATKTKAKAAGAPPASAAPQRAQMGINRIVVTDGKINARLVKP